MGSRFLRAAISIIFSERSIAVIRPLVSRSQTSDTATPCPQPTSSTPSAGSSARVSTAHTNRSEGLLDMPTLCPRRTSAPRRRRSSATALGRGTNDSEFTPLRRRRSLLARTKDLVARDQPYYILGSTDGWILSEHGSAFASI